MDEGLGKKREPKREENSLQCGVVHHACDVTDSDRVEVENNRVEYD